jgi:glycosyltransferase involved in cell wall biosynthesis
MTNGWITLHATSDGERLDCERVFTRSRAVVIPYGVDVVDTAKRTGGRGALHLLYLGRIHPQKAVENLLYACARWSGGHGGSHPPAWSLTIAGSGDLAYERRLGQIALELGISPRVSFVGEVAGPAKEQLFEEHDLLVLPSPSESFGMVIAEALAHGLPVIASKGTPWRRMDDVGCGLWVDHDPNSLAAAIRRMSTMPLLQMGAKGRAWMQTEFSWQSIAEQMLHLYQQSLGMTMPRPAIA